MKFGLVAQDYKVCLAVKISSWLFRLENSISHFYNTWTKHDNLNQFKHAFVRKQDRNASFLKVVQ